MFQTSAFSIFDFSYSCHNRNAGEPCKTYLRLSINVEMNAIWQKASSPLLSRDVDFAVVERHFMQIDFVKKLGPQKIMRLK